MKKIILVLFVCFLFSKVNALNLIEGRVTDTDNIPLVGAVVYLPTIQKGAVTDLAGKYVIDRVPDGDIKIRYSYIGYTPKEKNINVSGSVTKLNVALKTTTIQYKEVVVTGNYFNSQKDNIVKVEKIDSKDIKLLGTPNFMEALTTIPGVDMISKGQGVSKPVIRGLSMNNILVLDNNVRMENYQFSENHPLGIDGNDIEKVEIIKGPASLLYGSDAIGGVINFIKESPAPIGQIVGNYSMQLHSNTQGMNNSLGIKGATNKFYGGFRASNKSHSDYEQGGGDYVPNSRFNEQTINANVGYRSKVGNFKIFYDYFKQKLGMTTPASVASIDKRGRKNKIWYQNLDHNLVASQNTIYLGKYKLDINAAYQDALRLLDTNSGITAVEMDLKTITYNTKLHFPTNKRSKYIIGVQGMSQYNRNHNNRIAQFLPDADINNIGFIGMVQYAISDRLKLESGLRYDIYDTKSFSLGSEGNNNYHAPIDKQFSNFNGSIGSTYSINNRTTFRLNFAKGYRVPNLSELTSNGMHGSRYEIGNNDLSPQNSYETDASIHYNDKSLTLDASAFYNYIDNYIFISPTNELTSDNVNIYRYSQANARLYGGEAGFHYCPFSLSWFNVKGTYSVVVGKQNNDDYLPFIPAQKLRYEVYAQKNKLGFLNKPNLKISALTAFDQNNPSPYETSTSGYTIFNLSAYSEVYIANQPLHIGLSANNIFDKRYYDHLSTLKSLHYANQGRNICLTVTVPFCLLK